MDLSFEFVVPRTPLTTGQGGAVVAEELLSAMEFAVNAAEQAILPLVPVDRGLLRNGVQTQVFGQGVDLVGRVFDPLGYALPMEAGSRPHFPPPSALEGWVRRKLGISDVRQARSVAFVVARAIAKRGTKPREFFKRGWQAARPRVELRFDQALVRIRNRLVTT